MIREGFKAAILKLWDTQIEASIAMDIHEERLSKFIRHDIRPNPRERANLEKHLGKKLVAKYFDAQVEA